MTTYYKLTDMDGKTHNNTQWGPGITHEANGDGKELCTAAVIHVYDHPYKAVLFNPIHADFRQCKLWRVEVEGVVADDHLKVGVKRCTTVEEVPAPEFNTTQRVAFALYCALGVYHDPKFGAWAQRWLSGEDRSARAARAAGAAEAAWAAEAARAAEAAWAAEATIDFVSLAEKARQIK
jgi:hypothetical protein